MVLASDDKLEMLFLHALPLDGSMWVGQMELLPGSTCAPTLYSFGDSVEAWAAGALKIARSDRLIVVGCSVGGSCALEVALAAPNRIAVLVLIGTKAGHRPEPALHASALGTLCEGGLAKAWNVFWAPLFSPSADPRVISAAERIALRQSHMDVARGLTAFHNRPSRDQFLATFPRPVIFVTGADDRAPGPRACAAQADASPQGRLCVIPQCGHYAALERPDALNSILREVIAAHA
jgi:pimeloyl-[acyl-carrier protein] methyl ester esterase